MMSSWTRSIVRSAAVLVAAAAMASCGGGDGAAGSRATAGFREGLAATPAAAVERRVLAEPRRRPLLLGPNDPVDATATLDWAEWKFAQLFPKGPANTPFSYLGVSYTLRVYPNGNYLGITAAGEIFGLGPFTGGALIGFGNISTYATTVRGDRCSVYPGSCDPTGPVGGSLNECQPLAINTIATGARFRLEHEIRGAATGTMVSDGLVDGPATFEGKNAVQVTLTTVSTINGPGFSLTDNTVIRTFLQAGQNGLTLTLGNITESRQFGGTPTTTKQVFDPPYADVQFTIARGETISQTLTDTTTSLSPPGPARRNTETDTYTFEARESITVLGKAYDTCRYRERMGAGDVNVTWYHVGTGLPVKIDSGNGTAVFELRSGSFNGTPL